MQIYIIISEFQPASLPELKKPGFTGLRILRDLIRRGRYIEVR